MMIQHFYFEFVFDHKTTVSFQIAIFIEVETNSIAIFLETSLS